MLPNFSEQEYYEVLTFFTNSTFISINFEIRIKSKFHISEGCNDPYLCFYISCHSVGDSFQGVKHFVGLKVVFWHILSNSL